MSDVQREAYDGAEEIRSDVFGVLSRDNRNHHAKQDEILEAASLPPGASLLEVGCGDGIHAVRYAEQYEYTGVDISPSLCDRTRDRLAHHGLEGTVTVENALDLPYPDDAFDAVVGTAVLHHVHPHEDALAEWRRVTKPDGSIALMEPNYWFPKEIIETAVLPEERHKVNMRPRRLQEIFDAVDGVEWTRTPKLFTPPWPRRLQPLYDRVDAVCERLPVVRNLSMMQLIHGRVA